MRTIIKYLKGSVMVILLIIGLLIIQALCDLSLPDYTSKIVNIGIQQSGIEEVAPKIIRESEYDKLMLFMDEDEKEFVNSNYELLNKSTLSSDEYDQYIIEYPDLKNEPLYKEKDNLSKETREKLDDIFTEPIAVVSSFQSGNTEIKNMQDEITSSLPQGSVPDDADIFQVLRVLPESQLLNIRENIRKSFENIPESLASQSGISYVKAEYEKIGINTNKSQTQYITQTGIKMLTLAFVGGAATVLVSFLASRVAALLAKNLRKDVFEKVVNFSNNEFDKFSTASLITRTTNDIQQIQTFSVMMLRMIFYAPILGTGGLIKVLGTDRSMTWIIGVAILTIVIILSILFGSTMPKFKKVQIKVDKVNGVAREILTGIPVIRAFTTEKYEEKRFDKANRELTRTNLFVNRVMTFMMPAMMFIMNAISVLIVWVGAHAINEGDMQVGNLMAFIQYTMQIVMSFLMISMVSIMLPRALVSANRIEEVLNTEFLVADPEKPQEFREDKKGYVEYKNVSFKYPDSDDYILKDISFTARPGKVTAIIGSTGSGKSTLVNLIPRLFDVTSGELLVDGVNVRDVSQHNLREKIGFVPQKGILFSGTIESNIRYGKKNADMNEIEEAVRIAQAEHFVETKPEKYDTEISQGGTNVSGGQKQRLAIARAIVKKPEILVFDDSFSALDYKTDVALRKTLREERKESTRIVVAQRISTVLDAYEIIVLDKGKIVGKGSHKELMEKCEVYKQIALSQLSEEELGL
ncbi:MAG: ABC transporter ATP-binding protein [Clostridium sp.]|nr:ABC transporter ATP-binding protein [Clostridium sp.]